MKKITIGILAHVDSGKTTLSEALLYTSGTIRTFGRVDKADTFLDTHSLERKRGITIFSKQAKIIKDDCEITLLDTPGHVDFSSETERTLSVLDVAILVISGIDGVQSHTETLFSLLKKHKIPTFVFVNKMDIPSADKETLILGIKKKLSHSCIEEEKLSDNEECAVCDDELMEKYLSCDGITEEEINSSISNAKIYPVYFGSALKTQGVEKLLSEISKRINPKEAKDEFGARVYKITHDNNGKRLVHMKITGGMLSVKDIVSQTTQNGEKFAEKIDEIRIYSGERYETAKSVAAGDVCTVVGLSKVMAGDSLGIENRFPSPILEPVFNYKVLILDGSDPHVVYSKLKILEEEEPELRISYNKLKKEIKLLFMGQIQLEIIKNIIFERFGFEVDFDIGSVIYRETVEEMCEGVGHYEPLRHYSEVHLLIEPSERGSGLCFCTDCSQDELERNWQRLVLTHLEEKTHLGVLIGAPLTDVKITLVSGKAHKKHTEGGDFREATYRAVRQGLRKAKNVLLEPYYNYEITVPDNLAGRVMNDMQRMGAEISPPESDGENSVLTGFAPVSEIQHYGIALADFSHGKGRIICSFRGYEKCHNADEVIEAAMYDADADTENPSDSIFCANGAGFLVKWNEVEKYMHLESVLTRNYEKEKEEQELAQMARNYLSRVADDKELEAIFERTYGPIRRKQEGRVRVEAPKSENKINNIRKQKHSIFDGEEYLLVDGYNIIFAWEDLQKQAKIDLSLARNTLINRLCNYQGFCGNKIIIVFDAYKVKKNPGTVEEYRNISVVYTKEAETADTYIQRVSHELAKKHRVRVATSDGPEQLIILGNGALRVPATAFRKELLDAEIAIRNIIEN